jgi:hypothetical protein
VANLPNSNLNMMAEFEAKFVIDPYNSTLLKSPGGLVWIRPIPHIPTIMHHDLLATLCRNATFDGIKFASIVCRIRHDHFVIPDCHPRKQIWTCSRRPFVHRNDQVYLAQALLASARVLGDHIYTRRYNHCLSSHLLIDR